jgi:hypothetical protein
MAKTNGGRLGNVRSRGGSSKNQVTDRRQREGTWMNKRVDPFATLFSQKEPSVVGGSLIALSLGRF